MSKHNSHQGRKEAARPGGSVHGILLVDKPEGMTSHDVVSQARRVFRTRKIGHAGTLDPMATGVLVLLLGEATKLSNVLTGAEKHYLAEVTFGRSTDSLDATGTTTKQVSLAPDWLYTKVESGEVESALKLERVRTEQIPPLVSAIKVDGERAYKKARRGEEALMAPRVVAVKHLLQSSANEKRLSLDVLVSKGFYVRALARDIGDHLGVPAHLSALQRVASGNFRLEKATKWPPAGAPQLLDITQAATENLPSVCLNSHGFDKSLKGQLIKTHDLITTPNALKEGIVYAATFEDRLVALLEYFSEDDGLRVKRGILLPEDSKMRESSTIENG